MGEHRMALSAAGIYLSRETNTDLMRRPGDRDMHHIRRALQGGVTGERLVSRSATGIEGSEFEAKSQSLTDLKGFGFKL